jgi:hypothetical protein
MGVFFFGVCPITSILFVRGISFLNIRTDFGMRCFLDLGTFVLDLYMFFWTWPYFFWTWGHEKCGSLACVVPGACGEIFCGPG